MFFIISLERLTWSQGRTKVCSNSIVLHSLNYRMSVFVVDLHNVIQKDNDTLPVPHQLACLTAPFENRSELSVRTVKTSGQYFSSTASVLGQ